MMTLPANDGTFQDPLENYDPPAIDDPIERALHEEPVTEIQSQPHVTVAADLPVRDAINQMVGDHVACLLVEDQGQLVGVFSDRDVLDKVALEYDDVIDAPVRDVMTEEPVVVHDSDCAAAALAVVAVSGYRHVPIVDPEQRIAGIVSPQRITRFLTARFTDSTDA